MIILKIKILIILHCDKKYSLDHLNELLSKESFSDFVKSVNCESEVTDIKAEPINENKIIPIHALNYFDFCSFKSIATNISVTISKI